MKDIIVYIFTIIYFFQTTTVIVHHYAHQNLLVLQLLKDTVAPAVMNYTTMDHRVLVSRNSSSFYGTKKYTV